MTKKQPKLIKVSASEIHRSAEDCAHDDDTHFCIEPYNQLYLDRIKVRQDRRGRPVHQCCKFVTPDGVVQAMHIFHGKQVPKLKHHRPNVISRMAHSVGGATYIDETSITSCIGRKVDMKSVYGSKHKNGAVTGYEAKYQWARDNYAESKRMIGESSMMILPHHDWYLQTGRIEGEYHFTATNVLRKDGNVELQRWFRNTNDNHCFMRALAQAKWSQLRPQILANAKKECIGDLTKTLPGTAPDDFKSLKRAITKHMKDDKWDRKGNIKDCAPFLIGNKTWKKVTSQYPDGIPLCDMDKLCKALKIEVRFVTPLGAPFVLPEGHPDKVHWPSNGVFGQTENKTRKQKVIYLCNTAYQHVNQSAGAKAFGRFQENPDKPVDQQSDLLPVLSDIMLTDPQLLRVSHNPYGVLSRIETTSQVYVANDMADEIHKRYSKQYKEANNTNRHIVDCIIEKNLSEYLELGIGFPASSAFHWFLSDFAKGGVACIDMKRCYVSMARKYDVPKMFSNHVAIDFPDMPSGIAFMKQHIGVYSATSFKYAGDMSEARKDILVRLGVAHVLTSEVVTLPSYVLLKLWDAGVRFQTIGGAFGYGSKKLILGDNAAEKAPDGVRLFMKQVGKAKCLNEYNRDYYIGDKAASNCMLEAVGPFEFLENALPLTPLGIKLKEHRDSREESSEDIDALVSFVRLAKKSSIEWDPVTALVPSMCVAEMMSMLFDLVDNGVEVDDIASVRVDGIALKVEALHTFYQNSGTTVETREGLGRVLVDSYGHDTAWVSKGIDEAEYLRSVDDEPYSLEGRNSDPTTYASRPTDTDEWEGTYVWSSCAMTMDQFGELTPMASDPISIAEANAQVNVYSGEAGAGKTHRVMQTRGDGKLLYAHNAWAAATKKNEQYGKQKNMSIGVHAKLGHSTDKSKQTSYMEDAEARHDARIDCWTHGMKHVTIDEASQLSNRQMKHVLPQFLDAGMTVSMTGDWDEETGTCYQIGGDFGKSTLCIQPDWHVTTLELTEHSRYEDAGLVDMLRWMRTEMKRIGNEPSVQVLRLPAWFDRIKEECGVVSIETVFDSFNADKGDVIMSTISKCSRCCKDAEDKKWWHCVCGLATSSLIKQWNDGFEKRCTATNKPLVYRYTTKNVADGTYNGTREVGDIETFKQKSSCRLAFASTIQSFVGNEVDIGTVYIDPRDFFFGPPMQLLYTITSRVKRRCQIKVIDMHLTPPRAFGAPHIAHTRAQMAVHASLLEYVESGTVQNMEEWMQLVADALPDPTGHFPATERNTADGITNYVPDNTLYKSMQPILAIEICRSNAVDEDKAKVLDTLPGGWIEIDCQMNVVTNRLKSIVLQIDADEFESERPSKRRRHGDSEFYQDIRITSRNENLNIDFEDMSIDFETII